MVYEVTATRRRPQRFEDMIGQDFVVATLQKSVAAGKIAHAYLFSGPRGCGKTSSARILAKALNCETGPGATPCGTCPACVEITRGSSLDVIEIDGASNTSVNDIRQIKEEVQFPPNSCRYKVYIIDEVHMLSTSAFNALLKTIEEPPPYVVFIFATTELHKVPATIKSRCQQFNFRLVAVEQLKTVLAEAAGEMGIKADDEALFWVAREATGSVRDAYTLFDQVAAFSDGHITFDKIRDKLGLVGVDRINGIVEACVRRNCQAAFSFLDETLQNGVSVEQFTVDLAEYFRNMLFLGSGIVKESLLGQSPERFSSLVLKEWTPIQIERALGIVLQLFRDIRYSLEPRYELELAVSRLSWISDFVSSAEMKIAIAQAQNLLQRSSGPFSGADRSSGTQSQETIRTLKETGIAPCGISPPINESNPDDSETLIENPFAAIKQRINGNRFGQKGEAAEIPAAVPDISALMPAKKLKLSVMDSAVIEPAAAELAATEPAIAIPAEDMSEVSVEELKDTLVGFFQTSKNMVATSLLKSFDWKDNGATVRFSVDKPFVHNFLEQEHKALAEAVSRFLGRPSGIEIQLDTTRVVSETNASESKTVPPQVEMVRQMFKGTIVGES